MMTDFFFEDALQHGKVMSVDANMMNREGSVLLCLSKSVRDVLLAYCEYLGWPTRWYPKPTVDVAETFAEKATSELMTACDPLADLRFRQNGCTLQYSIDGGETWYTAYDYTLCRDVTVVYEDMSINEGVIAVDQEIYETGGSVITALSPNWGPGGESWDENKDSITCTAVRSWVITLCEATAQKIEHTNEDIDSIADWYKTLDGLVREAAGYILEIEFPEYIDIIGFVQGAAQAMADRCADAVAAWFKSDPSPYRDVAAREDVACLMVSALIGDTPTFAAWQDSLDTGDLGGNREIIRAMIHDVNQNENAFMEWLQLWGRLCDAYEAQGIGILEDCPCSDWELTLDLTAANCGFSDPDYGWWEMADIGDDCGHHVIGQGIVGDLIGENNYCVRGWIDLGFTYTVYQVIVDYYIDQPSPHNWWVNQWAYRLTGKGGDPRDDYWFWQGVEYTDDVAGANLDKTGGEKPQKAVRKVGIAINGSSATRYTKLIVRGRGIKHPDAEYI